MPKIVKTRQIEHCLDRARHFDMLSDPDTNHLHATHSGAPSAEKCAARAMWWRDRAAALLIEGLEKRAAIRARPRASRRRADHPVKP